MGLMARMGEMVRMGRMDDMVGWVVPTVEGTKNGDHTHSRKGKIGLMVRMLRIGRMGFVGWIYPPQMGKYLMKMGMTALLITAVWGNETRDNLQQNCLQCHQTQQIPSSLIYRRYLMKYSTLDRIEKAMFTYLKDPKKSHSIMPSQFFLKFPMKQPMKMDDAVMKRYIKAYIERFNVKKRLILQNKPE